MGIARLRRNPAHLVRCCARQTVGCISCLGRRPRCACTNGNSCKACNCWATTPLNAQAELLMHVPRQWKTGSKRWLQQQRCRKYGQDGGEHQLLARLLRHLRAKTRRPSPSELPEQETHLPRKFGEAWPLPQLARCRCRREESHARSRRQIAAPASRHRRTGLAWRLLGRLHRHAHDGSGARQRASAADGCDCQAPKLAQLISKRPGRGSHERKTARARRLIGADVATESTRPKACAIRRQAWLGRARFVFEAVAQRNLRQRPKQKGNTQPRPRRKRRAQRYQRRGDGISVETSDLKLEALEP